MDIIKAFSADRGIALDDFQVQACKALLDGCSVLVAAPTGSGKTLVADFAAYMVRDSPSRVIYTTPIKALSNQKYAEFCALYGENNVGLATGDRSIRPRARVTIMTTEVLRNIIYTDPTSLDDVSHVVLDEVHYISDRSRGAVWEEVIIQLPLSIDLVCLSATVSNAEEVAQWLTTVRGSTQAIIHEQRPIPLSYWFAFRKKRQGMHVLPLLSHADKDDVTVHPDLYRALRPKANSLEKNMSWDHDDSTSSITSKQIQCCPRSFLYFRVLDAMMRCTNVSTPMPSSRTLRNEQPFAKFVIDTSMHCRLKNSMPSITTSLRTPWKEDSLLTMLG